MIQITNCKLKYSIDPLLMAVGRKLKVGGRLIVGIKNEGVQYLREVPEHDIDNHLYTWNAPLLTNSESPLKCSAGFKLISSLRFVDLLIKIQMSLLTSYVTVIRAAGFHVDQVDPPLEQRRHFGRAWTEENISTPAAFIYHWAYATKGQKTINR